MVSTLKLLRSNLRVGVKHDAILVAWLLLALASGFLAYVARVHEVTHDVFHEMALFREALALGISQPMTYSHSHLQLVRPCIMNGAQAPFSTWSVSKAA